MAGRRFKVGPRITVLLNNAEFERVRKSSRLESILRVRGETWVSRLNTELHKAQRARKQPVADGYTYHIHDGGSRLRLYIVPFTARAMAHERKHSSILKLMETTKYDVVMRPNLTQDQQKVEAQDKEAEVRRARKDARDKAGDA